jgi:ribonuclease-3
MFLHSRFERIRARFSQIDTDEIIKVFPGAMARVHSLEKIQSHRYRCFPIALVALLHRSAMVYWPRKDQIEVQSNERLEYLGDALLGTFIASEAMLAFPELAEGQLSRLRAALVGTVSLSRKANDLGIGRILLLGKGELSSGGHRRQSLLADAFEAVTAALFIDAGEEKVWTWLMEVFGSDLILADKVLTEFDAKTRFQQWTQKLIGVPPTYRVIGSNSTPESTEFIVAGFIGDVELARSSGRNKRDASKQVAVKMQQLVDSGELNEEKLIEIYQGKRKAW